MTIDTATQMVEEVFNLYKQYGAAEYIGEPVTQLEHMSQAAQLAMDDGNDDEVILAAFFHDIGHICVMNDGTNSMDGFGIKSHEKIGADYLRSIGFPEKVAQLVENHVQAKRYLTAVDSDYYAKLSDASRKTLEFQGGIMTLDEADRFRKDPLFSLSIKMRQWDEEAKETGVSIIDLDLIKEKARSLLLKTPRRR